MDSALLNIMQKAAKHNQKNASIEPKPDTVKKKKKQTHTPTHTRASCNVCVLCGFAQVL